MKVVAGDAVTDISSTGKVVGVGAGIGPAGIE